MTWNFRLLKELNSKQDLIKTSILFVFFIEINSLSSHSWVRSDLCIGCVDLRMVTLSFGVSVFLCFLLWLIIRKFDIDYKHKDTCLWYEVEELIKNNTENINIKLCVQQAEINDIYKKITLKKVEKKQKKGKQNGRI